MRISIILPTYNEAGNIAKLIKAIHTQPGLKPYQLEFIVVDDNSPDDTATEVKKLTKKIPVKLFVRKNIRGLATAILHGLKKSTGKIIVLMDADFNHQPKDVFRLLQPILNQKADLAIGSRYIPGGGMHATEANKLQFLLSKYGNYFVNRLLLNLPIHESLSGFVAFKRKILNDLDTNHIFRGYGEYCIRLLYKIHQQGYKISEVSVNYGKRQYGQSKSQLFLMAIDYFKTALKLKLQLLNAKQN